MKSVEVRVYIGWEGEKSPQDRERFIVNEFPSLDDAVNCVTEYIRVTHENMMEGLDEAEED